MPVMVDAGSAETRSATALRDELGVQTSIFYPAVHEFTVVPRALSGRRVCRAPSGPPAARSRSRCSRT